MTLQDRFSRWKARHSERVRNPRRLWLRRLFALLGIMAAVWAVRHGLTYTGLPYARASEELVPWLRARDSLMGVALFLASIAYLLPRSQSEVAAMLLVLTEVAFCGWFVSILVLAIV